MPGKDSVIARILVAAVITVICAGVGGGLLAVGDLTRSRTAYSRRRRLERLARRTPEQMRTRFLAGAAAGALVGAVIAFKVDRAANAGR